MIGVRGPSLWIVILASTVALPLSAADVEKIELPTSEYCEIQGQNECWMFAAMNAIESTYLAQHPKSDLLLSRNAMRHWLGLEIQAASLVGRAKEYVEQAGKPPPRRPQNRKQSVDAPRGTAIDAIRLAQAYGLVQAKDDPNGPGPKSGFTPVPDTSPEDNLRALLNEIDAKYGEVPSQTKLDGTSMTPQELAHAVLMGHWVSYAWQDNVEKGWKKHPDADNHFGDTSYWFRYEPKKDDALPRLIKAALKAGHAMEVSIGGHSIELYGGEYDKTTENRCDIT